MANTNETTTQHNHQVIFGRREAGCPRCAELAAGAPARRGWGDLKRRSEQDQLRAIRNHNCATSHCGPVCTFGDP